MQLITGSLMLDMEETEIHKKPKLLKCFLIQGLVNFGFHQYNAIQRDALRIQDIHNQIHLKLIIMRKWLYNIYPGK